MARIIVITKKWAGCLLKRTAWGLSSKVEGNPRARQHSNQRYLHERNSARRGVETQGIKRLGRATGDAPARQKKAGAASPLRNGNATQCSKHKTTSSVVPHLISRTSPNKVMMLFTDVMGQRYAPGSQMAIFLLHSIYNKMTFDGSWQPNFVKLQNAVLLGITKRRAFGPLPLPAVTVKRGEK
jgi:hypothetical protein